MKYNLSHVMFKLLQCIGAFWNKYREAIFVTKRQYRLRILHCYCAPNKKYIAVAQVIIKRIKIKLSARYLASNPKLLQDVHPVNACKLAFIANLEGALSLKHLPVHMRIGKIASPTIKQPPTVKIKSRAFFHDQRETHFTLSPIGTTQEVTLPSQVLAKNHELLYGLGSTAASQVGLAASEDFLSQTQQGGVNLLKEQEEPTKFIYYHVLCVFYVALILSGMSIVRRMFPFHVPFTDWIVPFGAGIVFFPLTFAIQDITTEVYGFSRGRQMIWLAIFMVIFYIFYTQIAIHLPDGIGPVYQDNPAFATVFNTIPRQFIAFIVSMLAGTLINDFFISKSKIIFGGQYLWARLVGSTMIGEAVLQVVGGIIGFSDKLDFTTQLLPNMGLAYSYKLLWNGAMVPVIYMVSTYLKKKEDIDIYDYNVSYNPFKFSAKVS